MKKLIILLTLVLLVMFMLLGCNFIEEQKAERIIVKYYEAMIDEDYEEAFKQLHLYDDSFNDGTSLSKKEAEEIFREKIDYLKEQKYRIQHYEIVEVEYEDGHSFWHHIKLWVEQNGQQEEWDEVALIYNGGLVISEKEDPFVKYRNGQMIIEQ